MIIKIRKRIVIFDAKFANPKKEGLCYIEDRHGAKHYLLCTLMKVSRDESKGEVSGYQFLFFWFTLIIGIV